MTAEAGARADRPAPRHRGQDPGNLTRPGPDSPIRSTADLHNRLTGNPGPAHGAGHIIGIAVAVLVAVSLAFVIKFFIDLSYAP